MRDVLARGGMVCASLLAAVAWAGPASAEPLKLRVADSFPAGHYIGEKITKPWMAEITRRSKEAVVFEYYPSEQLGKAKDLLSLTAAGVTDIGYVAPSFVTDKMPLSAVAELPARFTTSCEGTQAYFKLARDGGLLAKREFAPNGIRLLFTIVLPPYQVFLSKQKLDGLKSVEGLKIRTTGGAKELAVRKLGAVPIQMSTPEVYEALSRGTIDGMMFPFSSIFSYDLQGLVKHATTGENFGSFVVNYVISERRWKSLPPDVQKAMVEVGEETVQRACEISQEGEQRDRERLKASGVDIVELSAADREAVRQSMASVNTEWAQALDKRGKPGSEVLKAFEEALK